MNYDLTIAHRVCSAVSATAFVFMDKLKMVEYTADSMKESLAGIRHRLILILDGCSEAYEKVFTSRFPAKSLEIIRTNSIGNLATFSMQIGSLRAVTDSNALYFSEDDYWYKPDAFRAMLDFLTKKDVDFVSPLDHPDRYNNALLGRIPTIIRTSEFCHWRESDTTCCTYMLTPETLAETRCLMDCYPKGAGDGVLWLGLTKAEAYNFHRLLRAVMCYVMRRRSSYATYLPLCTWKWLGLKMLTTRRYHLWSPIPTLAVHLSNKSLPLYTDAVLPGLSDEERALVRKLVVEYLAK